MSFHQSKGKRKRSQLKFRLWHILQAARKWWSFTSNCQLHLPKSLSALHCHSNWSVQCSSAPQGSLHSVSAAILWDAGTRALQHPSLQQCCPRDHRNHTSILTRTTGGKREELAAPAVGGKWKCWEIMNKARKQLLMLDFLKERRAQHHCAVDSGSSLCSQFYSK